MSMTETTSSITLTATTTIPLPTACATGVPYVNNTAYRTCGIYFPCNNNIQIDFSNLAVLDDCITSCENNANCVALTHITTGTPNCRLFTNSSTTLTLRDNNFRPLPTFYVKRYLNADSALGACAD